MNDLFGVPPTTCARRRSEHAAGCLLGGAVGDALGAPVEFMTLPEIRAKFGGRGIRDYYPAYGSIGAITDDTQITLSCALKADTFEDGVILAVNHSGDSDSTGAITGNILGALLGRSAIPSKWLERLELRQEIEEVALDLCRHFGYVDVKPIDDDEDNDFDKYPPN